MINIKDELKDFFISFIKDFYKIKDDLNLNIVNSPQEKYGDFSLAIFSLAKIIKKSPVIIAKEIIDNITEYRYIEDIKIEGSYLNIKINRDAFSNDYLSTVEDNDLLLDNFNNEKITIEFSSPNTNKPLHLGHLRNNALGESLSRIFKNCKANVFKVNLINDRGIHICYTMLAYKEFCDCKTPESFGLRGDRFIGDLYVKFSNWDKENKTDLAKEMLLKWEENDPETRALWSKLNAWVIEGIKQTYKNTDISFDKYYYESDFYNLGKQDILKGLKKGIFYQKEDGSIWVDLTDVKLDHKALLRSNQTTLYITQDIASINQRYEDFNFSKHIYIVGSEQEYHFKVLFEIFKKLGQKWVKDNNFIHLSYGMVNLPDGKMKSREGNVIDGDDLLSKLYLLSYKELKERDELREESDLNDTAKKIALGALHYFLLNVNPSKDMLFDSEKSISFNGNTGPYIQYTGARLYKLLDKYKNNIDSNLPLYKDLKNKEYSSIEWNIIILLSEYKNIVLLSATNMNPSIITNYIYELCSLFSNMYHQESIIYNENREIIKRKIFLIKIILKVLKHLCNLVVIPFLNRM